ncbi:MAG: universal stress protein [Gammaproteobacteria bacterium]|nr:universal stress protein [Gammaproteobacteria bacterium]
MYKSIVLAVGHLGHPHRRAIARTAEIARRSGARVELFHALGDPSYLRTLAPAGGRETRTVMREAAHGARLQLQRLAAARPFAGLQVNVHSEWDYPVWAAIVRRVQRIGADLVVTETHGHSRAARWLFGSVDWELVRGCPCPLLIVRSRGTRLGDDVLAAIDPLHSHDKPARLDRAILRQAAGLAQLLDGTLHVGHAWLPLMMVLPASPAVSEPLYLPPEATRSYQRAIERGFRRLTQPLRLAARQLHLARGDVTSELPRMARRARASTVVMGAVSRSGLKNLVIGHTAQRLMDRLPSDILVVKPPGFRTHVRRRRFSPRNAFPITPL